VVGDDLDDAMRGLPTVLVDVRRVDADLRLARLPLLQELPMGERSAVEIQLVEILGRGVRVVSGDELLDLVGLWTREPLPDVLDRLPDERRLRFLRLDRHPGPLAAYPSAEYEPVRTLGRRWQSTSKPRSRSSGRGARSPLTRRIPTTRRPGTKTSRRSNGSRRHLSLSAPGSP